MLDFRSNVFFFLGINSIIVQKLKPFHNGESKSMGLQNFPNDSVEFLLQYLFVSCDQIHQILNIHLYDCSEILRIYSNIPSCWYLLVEIYFWRRLPEITRFFNTYLRSWVLGNITHGFPLQSVFLRMEFGIMIGFQSLL